MNSREQLSVFIIERLQQVLKDRGIPQASFSENSSLLNGTIDSLDLAALVVELQQKTNKDPFKQGIISFESVGDLAALYAS
jgi:acyl carrier protein